ncbi:MAG: hypothetical protein DDT37_01775 [Firmicutes bacterium]|nr:hypothetical protein [candidate division NPL-UPA2 bacterium]
MSLSELTMLSRLTLACVLGGAIGLQREGLNRPAGFRTHVLVALGSALIMLLSAYGFQEFGQPYDPARLAAQVVSGIGFLGAGTIMREGTSIRGLTTAASLWVVAGIGLASGAGFYLSAIVTTILVYLTLGMFFHLERRLINPSSYVKMAVVTQDQPGQLGRIGASLGGKNISVRNITIDRADVVEGYIRVRLELKFPKGMATAEAMADLAALPDVATVCELDK